MKRRPAQPDAAEPTRRGRANLASADPGRLARPAQDAGQGKLDLFGQARGIAEARLGTRGGAGLGSGG
jgi:hypothetical protein